MKNKDLPVTKRPLFWWVFAGDLRLQILLIIVILFTVVVRVVPLEMQKIRVVWNLYRFGVKASINFFNSLSPFFIFIFGGYLAINGRLDIGALVASLSAQEKLFTPWKEMIDLYQDYQDASVSYYRTMEYFDALPPNTFSIPRNDCP